jgi:hypothetical protein
MLVVKKGYTACEGLDIWKEGEVVPPSHTDYIRKTQSWKVEEDGKQKRKEREEEKPKELDSIGEEKKIEDIASNRMVKEGQTKKR